MDSLKWLLATRNAGKIRELQVILKETPIEVVSLEDLSITQESPETGTTFVENAMQKARFYHELAGIPTLADDSGLEVDALNGAPGIHSARFGGFETHAEKCAYLLGLLAEVSGELRTARFHCAAVGFDGRGFLSAEGSLEGYIGDRPIGSGGFGYDPIFHMERNGPSMAELDMAEKNRVSHRAEAFRALVQAISGTSNGSSAPNGKNTWAGATWGV